MSDHEQDPIHGVIGRARRRVMLQEAIAQGMTAACLGLAGAIVILLVGTQLLDWHWLLLLIGGSLIVGAWRLFRRLPEPYCVAQLVDNRMGLSDALSTAWFFSTAQDQRVPKDVLVCQRNMAERLSRNVDVRAAIPFSLPRTALLFGGLLATTGSLFALRYGVEHRLDVRAPLIQVMFDAFGGRFETKMAKQQGTRRESPDTDPPAGIQADDKRFEDEKQLDAAPDKVLDTIEVPDVDNDRLGTEKGDQKGAGKGTGDPQSGEESTEGDPGENPTEGESSSDSSAKDGEAGRNSKSADEDSGGQQAPGGAEENSSLAQKFREAMNNLMSKMKPQSGANMAQTAKSQGGTPQSSIQQKGAGSKGAAEKGQQQGEKGPGEDGEPGESNEGQSSEGASKGKSSENAASQTPGSGMGKQDGTKDVRAAEQMEAMGKISEILGKRSQNVTGEATVEVQSTKQNIRTPYSQNASVHGQGGGEIHRDEVPEGLQHYVQQYFQKVRQQPAAPLPPGGSPK